MADINIVIALVSGSDCIQYWPALKALLLSRAWNVMDPFHDVTVCLQRQNAMFTLLSDEIKEIIYRDWQLYLSECD